jgi:hypothetical protein
MKILVHVASNALAGLIVFGLLLVACYPSSSMTRRECKLWMAGKLPQSYSGSGSARSSTPVQFVQGKSRCTSE